MATFRVTGFVTHVHSLVEETKIGAEEPRTEEKLTVIVNVPEEEYATQAFSARIHLNPSDRQRVRLGQKVTVSFEDGSR